MHLPLNVLVLRTRGPSLLSDRHLVHAALRWSKNINISPSFPPHHPGSWPEGLRQALGPVWQKVKVSWVQVWLSNIRVTEIHWQKDKLITFFCVFVYLFCGQEALSIFIFPSLRKNANSQAFFNQTKTVQSFDPILCIKHSLLPPTLGATLLNLSLVNPCNLVYELPIKLILHEVPPSKNHLSFDSCSTAEWQLYYWRIILVDLLHL